MSGCTATRHWRWFWSSAWFGWSWAGAGNQIVIELVNGLFVLLAHLQHGSVRVREGDLVRVGDELARIGNSGNTTLPHLHLQVQTHVDIWDPDNRSVPFAFDTDGRVPIRNDRIQGGRTYK